MPCQSRPEMHDRNLQCTSLNEILKSVSDDHDGTQLGVRLVKGKQWISKKSFIAKELYDYLEIFHS